MRSVTGPLPKRGEYLIRGAYVLTMDKAGDLPDADVHVKNGDIIAVGKGLSAPGAETIDARGMLVLPGRAALAVWRALAPEIPLNQQKKQGT